MPVHSRLVQRKDLVSDVEKAPLVDADDDLDAGLLKGNATRHSAWRYLVPLVGLLVLYGTYHGSAVGGVKVSDLGFPWPGEPEPLPPFVSEGMKRCEEIARPPPNPSPATKERTHSDRYVKGTRPVWLKNATLWTGEDDGKEVRYGAGVWLEGGVVRKIGSDEELAPLLAATKGKKDKDVDEVDLHGAWITPGIVDMHSHMGLNSLPEWQGSQDTNSLKGAIQPWLRSLDAFNTHDTAFNLSISGGITTMLVLPGSAGNIGGQAFTFKPRWTAENTPQSMQVEPPFVIDRNDAGKTSWKRTGAWRHIKHACGENPHRVYKNSRMDSAYDFRRAYNEGKQLKAKQEEWCRTAKTQKEPFPESLEWEVMADIIRGNVKVNIHCYETVDINDMVRISNEFEFPIAAFHHAHETYLVPDILRQAWGPVTPAAALFANHARYKREAYRGSPFAPKILDEAGIRVAMKSDHPVLDSRHLVYEAAQAHAYGMEWNRALASVTTKPSEVAGLDHRLGYVRPGYDADLVVWDSFPLALGATPKQTYIDGIPQILDPHVTHKPAAAQKITPKGDYDKEAAEALAARGDPNLRPKKRAAGVVFRGVNAVYLPEIQAQGEPGVVVVENGKITCAGKDCAVDNLQDYEAVDLKGGSIAPGLITYGAAVGISEITQEIGSKTGISQGLQSHSGVLDRVLTHAVDGAQFGGKDELMAYRDGVTMGVTAPEVFSGAFLSGMSYSFSLSAEHALEKGAIGNPAAALHVTITMPHGDDPLTGATAIASLRALLHGEGAAKGEVAEAFKRVADGRLRLVVTTDGVDIIAPLIRIKRSLPKMRLTISGGQEAWVLADELAKEDIGVVTNPSRSFPTQYDRRRNMAGPPLTNMSLPAYLHSRGVKVGLGISEVFDARLTRFDAAWAFADAPNLFSRQDALNLVSKNLVELLGLDDNDSLAPHDLGFVAYEGDMFSFQGRVRAIRPPGQDAMDLL